LSKAKAISHAKPTSFRLQLKDAEQIAAEAMNVASGRKLGRTAESVRRAQEDATAAGFEKGREEGFSRGYELGMLAASDQCREHIEDFLTELQKAVGRVDAAMEGWYERSEEQLGRLAVVIAAQILGREIKTDSEIVLPFVKEALKEVAIADRVRIRLNPFDSDTVREHQAELLAMAPSVERVEIVNDPAISGGCLVESDAGAIDTTISAKLNLILEALREAA
jgi:flagellar assembly protein FliH